MKKYIVVLFFLGIYWGQAQTTEYNTKENQPYYPTTVNQKDVYIKERCVLDIYYPTNQKNFATIVWFHGGGLTGGNKYIPEALKNKGVAIVARVATADRQAELVGEVKGEIAEHRPGLGVHIAQRLREEYGVPVPVPSLRIVATFGEDEYRLTAFGARIATGRLRSDAVLQPQPATAANANKLPGFYPAVVAGEWVQGGEGTQAPLEVLGGHMTAAIRRRMGGFLGIQETSNLFAKMQRDYPDLVKEMLRPMLKDWLDDNLPTLVERLVREEIERVARGPRR